MGFDEWEARRENYAAQCSLARRALDRARELAQRHQRRPSLRTAYERAERAYGEARRAYEEHLATKPEVLVMFKVRTRRTAYALRDLQWLRYACNNRVRIGKRRAKRLLRKALRAESLRAVREGA
jgi:hypothetical protein